MLTLVNPNQCSFVHGWQGNENIIIAQEVLHSMKMKTGKKGWMAIKIYLKKSYDHLKWCFVKETLLECGLPANFINLIWYCIFTSSTKVLWKEEALDSFSPSIGRSDLTLPICSV